ncbi:MAG: BrnT family toxin [Micrococcales bacterium]|nr:BrnT family toxin [Micrococcales bacterium]
MDELRFEWDPDKDSLNRAKHGVSFDEARTVFFDPRALVIDDPDHSQAEERFIILGHSRALRLLVVAHCYRQAGGVIRIISARKATRREAIAYPGGERHGQ